MKRMNIVRAYGAKLVTGGSAALLASGAFAQASDPISTVLGSVSLTGIATTVAALALVLVAIKLTFKGPDVAARVIRKV